MHNTQQSFAVRQRMLNVDGVADNQVIWFMDARPAVAADATPLAFQVVDEWMSNMAANPDLGVAANKPAMAVDACFATDGGLLASGDRVRNGILDDAEPRACTEQFPVYSSSRRVAGGPYEGGIWKCALQPVARGWPRVSTATGSRPGPSGTGSRRSSPPACATTESPT